MLMIRLARAKNPFAYNEACDVAELAAACAFGISQNHPFRDGNKGVAFLERRLVPGPQQGAIGREPARSD